MAEHPQRGDESLIRGLMARYGAVSAASGTSRLPDPNDVAAYAAGRASPAARARIEAALREDPYLSDQIAFARAADGGRASLPWRRRVAGIAAAAAILVAAGAWALSDAPVRNPVDEGRRLLAAGEPRAALEVLADADSDAAKVLAALARMAAGETAAATGPEPLAREGLALALPLGAQEAERLAAHLDPVLRSGGDAPWLAPRGTVLDERPVFVVGSGTGAVDLLLTRLDRTEPLVRRRLDVGDGIETLRVPFPPEAPALEAGVPYALELRDPDGTVVATTTFSLVDPAVRARCVAVAVELAHLLPDASTRSLALCNLYLRHELYADAREALRAVPASARGASWSQLHDLVRRSFR